MTESIDISLITSLYRSERHLLAYKQRVQEVARALRSDGIALEVILVANNATEKERDLLEQFTETTGEVQVTRLHVERETIYASWNRGMDVAAGDILGPWNVDDARSESALIEGFRLLRQGYTLVDFSFEIIQTMKRFGLIPQERRSIRPVPFHPEHFGRNNGIGPFSLFTRALYQQVGAFDPNFRIAGDLEWGGRAMAYANFHPGEAIGGSFHLHGDNLSSTGDPRQVVEDNIIFMRRQEWDQIRPAQPDLMRDCWESWDNADIDLPNIIAEFLWGNAAMARWQRYQREKRANPLIRRFRLALARRGILYSEEWTVTQATKNFGR